MATTTVAPHQQKTAQSARAWTAAERGVVIRGFFGRMTIGIEQLVLGLFFAMLPIGLLLRGQEIALLVAPIFGLGALAFIAYAVYLTTPCMKALFATFLPIYKINGYVRYRQERPRASAPVKYYVAVLDSDQKVMGEWRMDQWPDFAADRPLWPAVVEYSSYGGIHTIDGYPTGVLPAETSPLGVNIAHDAERRKLLFQ